LSAGHQVQEAPSDSTTAAPTITTATEISPPEAETTDTDDSV